MPILSKTNLQKLYEIDEHLWLEETINLLKKNRLNKLDIVNLIGELESLSRKDLNKALSLLRQIIIHITLLEYWQEEYQRNYRHWQSEVSIFRFDLNDHLTTNLRNKLKQRLNEQYQKAIKVVEKKTGLTRSIFPVNCPYTLEHLLNENWLPNQPENE